MCDLFSRRTRIRPSAPQRISVNPAMRPSGGTAAHLAPSVDMPHASVGPAGRACQVRRPRRASVRRPRHAYPAVPSRASVGPTACVRRPRRASVRQPHHARPFAPPRACRPRHARPSAPRACRPRHTRPSAPPHASVGHAARPSICPVRWPRCALPSAPPRARRPRPPASPRASVRAPQSDSCEEASSFCTDASEEHQEEQSRFCGRGY